MFINSLRSALAIMLVSTFGTCQALTLNFDPFNQTELTQNSVVEINIVASDIGNNGLGAFDFSIGFNPLVLSFLDSSSTLGDQLNFLGLDLQSLGFAGFDGQTSPQDSIIRVFEVSLDPAPLLISSQADTFVLATLQFETIGKGVSQMTIFPIDFGDANGDPISGPFGNLSGFIKTIPEPASLPLLGIGFFFLLCMHRRMQQRYGFEGV